MKKSDICEMEECEVCGHWMDSEGFCEECGFSFRPIDPMEEYWPS